MGITYKPIQEVTIYQIEKHNKKDFLRQIVHPNLDKVGWADGIMFMLHFINPGDGDVTQDLIDKQIIHLASIDFCECDYEEKVKVDGLNFEIMVIDQSKNKLVKQIIEYVKKGDWKDA